MHALINPVVLVSAGLAFGFYAYPAGFLPLCLSFAAASAGITLSALRLRRAAGYPTALLVIAAAAGIFAGVCLGLYLRSLEFSRYWGLPPERVVKLEGRVIQDSRPSRSGGAGFPVRVHRVRDFHGNRATARTDVWVLVPGGGRYFWGDVLEIDGRPSAGGKDGRFFVYAGGSPPHSTPASRFYGLRAGILRRIGEVTGTLGGPWAGLLAALLLGVREDLDRELAEVFRRSGAAHILALSGMHLGLAAVLLRFFLRPLFGRGAGDILTLVFIVAYVLLVGPLPSILRAALMFAVYILLRCLGRRPEGMTLLSVSFLVMSVLRTEDLGSPSFILSYLAIAGIILLSRRIRRLLIPVVPEPLLSPLSVSLAAQLAVSPVLLFLFGAIHPAGVLSSVFLGPIIAIFLWTGIPACAVAGFAPGASILLQGFQFVLKYLYTAVTMIAGFFARFPSWGGG